uniref:Uncharacterized protein n=1 Tax=Rousettus aegyptiacus TaxID=9407 RepID=A0A7J8HRB0_ROUAE|nr:hypothetical protein HJG63_011033 [Rousettus aegyptiacus]
MPVCTEVHWIFWAHADFLHWSMHPSTSFKCWLLIAHRGPFSGALSLNDWSLPMLGGCASPRPHFRAILRKYLTEMVIQRAGLLDSREDQLCGIICTLELPQGSGRNHSAAKTTALFNSFPTPIP